MPPHRNRRRPPERHERKPPPLSAEQPPRRSSLRGRLLSLLLPATVGLWVVGGWLIYVESRQLANRLADQALHDTGALLLQLAQHEIEEHGLSLGVLLLQNEALPGDNAFRYQVWTADSQSAYRSAGTPSTPLRAPQIEGYSDARLDDRDWRIYAVWNKSHTLQIQIAQSVDYARGMARDIAVQLVLTLSLLLALAAILIWLIVTAATRPLQATADAVASRSPDDLRAVRDDGAPAEVLPLVSALNRLLERMRDTLQQERRFTADAAHELRTPLAAMRANAQVIGHARNDSERDEALADLQVSVDRGSRVIDQLLQLARADAQAGRQRPADEVDLAELIEAQCSAQAADAGAAGVTLHAVGEPCLVQGRLELLSVLLRNLIENAIRYSPPGARIEIGCHATDAGVELSVDDNGPGIPEHERQRVFDRFYRLADARRSGSGLGLSIVRRIAELHRATVDIETGSSGRGTRVTVRFPRHS